MRFLPACILFSALLAFSPLSAQAQATQPRPLPKLAVFTLDSQAVDLQQLVTANSMTLFVVYASYLKPCTAEMDTLQRHYADWKKEYGAEIVAVNTDLQKSWDRVQPQIAKRGWTFRFLRDPQRQFPSRLDAQALPKTFLVDRSGSIVQTWKGWEAGMEVEFEEAMRELSKK